MACVRTVQKQDEGASDVQGVRRQVGVKLQGDFIRQTKTKIESNEIAVRASFLS